jgi:hypothetical protein
MLALNHWLLSRVITQTNTICEAGRGSATTGRGSVQFCKRQHEMGNRLTQRQILFPSILAVSSLTGVLVLRKVEEHLLLPLQQRLLLRNSLLALVVLCPAVPLDWSGSRGGG